MNVQLESQIRFTLSLVSLEERKIEWVLEQVKNGGHVQGLLDGAMKLPTINKSEDYLDSYQKALEQVLDIQQLAA